MSRTSTAHGTPSPIRLEFIRLEIQRVADALGLGEVRVQLAAVPPPPRRAKARKQRSPR